MSAETWANCQHFQTHVLFCANCSGIHHHCEWCQRRLDPCPASEGGKADG